MRCLDSRDILVQNESYMVGFEKITVKLQSGVDINVHAWAGRDDAQPLLIIAPDSSPTDWDDFVEFLSRSHSPVYADVSSSIDLLQLIWEIGEPVLLMTQGEPAAELASKVVSSAPGAVTSLVVCDGTIGSDRIDDMHEIATLILRGRQSDTVTHQVAVQMHDALRHSILIEPENCANFPAKDNADAAASAVNWFISGAGKRDGERAEFEPVDPKAS
jgi:hypothetical protein